MAAAKVGASEDILGHKTDLSISNAIVKTGTGFGAGVLLSALLFRRRAWPVWLFTGAGIGSAYSDASRIFNPAAIPGYRVASVEKAVSASPSSSSSSSAVAAPVQASSVPPHRV